MVPISGGRSSSGCVESKIFRHPRGHLVKASRYSDLQLRKEVWAELGSQGGAGTAWQLLPGQVVFILL